MDRQFYFLAELRQLTFSNLTPRIGIPSSRHLFNPNDVHPDALPHGQFTVFRPVLHSMGRIVFEAYGLGTLEQMRTAWAEAVLREGMELVDRARRDAWYIWKRDLAVEMERLLLL